MVTIQVKITDPMTTPLTPPAVRTDGSLFATDARDEMFTEGLVGARLVAVGSPGRLVS
jgi:hypothetical protein